MHEAGDAVRAWCSPTPTFGGSFFLLKITAPPQELDTQGIELWSCFGDWSQLLRHVSASGIQLSSPHELGEPLSPLLLGDDEG